jgi:para-nitrobenzyl esterase
MDRANCAIKRPVANWRTPAASALQDSRVAISKYGERQSSMDNFRFRFAAIVVLFLFSFSLFADDNPVAKTDLGLVRGKISADRKISIFLGIPYAAPPTGPLRWKPPQPAAPWSDTRNTTTFGSRCMQLPIFSDMVFTDPGMSEDCLTLNVWAPGSKGGKLPVMVWIYGGGFQAGTTSEPRQNGEALAHKGVIVVSMNYRMGMFGFFASHDLAEESPHHAAGNYGLLDQLAALEWVQRNIAAFGGDPGNVTIFGESAGSFSVNAQMASTLSRSLIAHAIGESGGAAGKSALPMPDRETAQKDDEQFAKDVLQVENLAALRALSADELLNRLKTLQNPFRFGPIVDGYFLPDSIPAIFAANKQVQIPLLAGWNKNERHFQNPDKSGKFTMQGLKDLAQQKFGPQAAEFLKVYRASNDQEALLAADDFSSDSFIGFGTWSWLEAQVKSGVTSVFRYRFDLGSPGDPNHPATLGAFHSDEIEYVFGTLDSRKGTAWRPEDYKLSELMQTYWTNFAKTGNPNGGDIPNWPTYGPEDGWQVLHLDQHSAAKPDEHRDRYLFLQKAWGK